MAVMSVPLVFVSEMSCVILTREKVRLYVDQYLTRSRGREHLKEMWGRTYECVHAGAGERKSGSQLQSFCVAIVTP